MMSDFGVDGESEMTPKNRTVEGKNRTLGGDVGSKIVGHHLWMIPNGSIASIKCLFEVYIIKKK